jgi:hypothetical protein
MGCEIRKGFVCPVVLSYHRVPSPDRDITRMGKSGTEGSARSGASFRNV